MCRAARPNRVTRQTGQRLTKKHSAADWSKSGHLQDAIMADPEMQALMADPNSPSTTSTYIGQTIPAIERRNPSVTTREVTIDERCSPPVGVPFAQYVPTATG